MRGERSLSLIFRKISTEGLNVSTVPINEVLVYFRNFTNILKIYNWLLEIQSFKIYNVFISSINLFHESFNWAFTCVGYLYKNEISG